MKPRVGVAVMGVWLVLQVRLVRPQRPVPHPSIWRGPTMIAARPARQAGEMTGIRAPLPPNGGADFALWAKGFPTPDEKAFNALITVGAVSGPNRAVRQAPSIQGRQATRQQKARASFAASCPYRQQTAELQADTVRLAVTMDGVCQAYACGH
jgi:hypothetical protein